MAASLGGLASAAAGQHDHRQAEHFYQAELDIRRRTDGPQHGRVASSLSGLGKSLLKLGRYDEARDALLEALEIARHMPSTDELFDASISAELAYLEAEAGIIEQAQAHLQAALPVLQSGLGDAHPERIDAEITQAMVLNARSMHQASYDHLHPIVARLARLPASEFSESDLLARGWRELGKAQFGMGKKQDAAASWDQALALLRASPFPDLDEIRAIERLISATR